jgi:bifunctional UDP-N-acetylglucosamine pyrophosphorylase/glucosamine-1-phosphate N-acetyltransferase
MTIDPPQPPLDAETALSRLSRAIEKRMAECVRRMLEGVTIVDAATTYIESAVQIGAGTVIHPNTTLSGATAIGRNCRIGPNSVIDNSRIGDGCSVFASVVEDSEMDASSDVGPFSHLRSGAFLETGVHVGNFVEIKSSRVGAGTKAGHFSYIGDASIGHSVNIGAGTVTCNYDGRFKHETIIEDDVFVGSDTMLVAPVTIGKGAATGAGSVVTSDVPAGSKVAGVPARPLTDDRPPDE